MQYCEDAIGGAYIRVLPMEHARYETQFARLDYECFLRAGADGAIRLLHRSAFTRKLSRASEGGTQ